MKIKTGDYIRLKECWGGIKIGSIYLVLSINRLVGHNGEGVRNDYHSAVVLNEDGVVGFMALAEYNRCPSYFEILDNYEFPEYHTYYSWTKNQQDEYFKWLDLDKKKLELIRSLESNI